MSDDSLDAQFQQAAADVQAQPNPGNDVKLRLYGLFKQATEGDVTGSRPGMLDPKGRAKFDAWTGRKGTAQADAKARYVTLVGELVKKLG